MNKFAVAVFAGLMTLGLNVQAATPEKKKKKATG